MPSPDPTLIFTAPDIARMLNKSHITIQRAASRLALTPAFRTRSNISLYNAAQVEQIRACLKPTAIPAAA